MTSRPQLVISRVQPNSCCGQRRGRPLVSGHRYLVQLSMTEIVGSSSIVGEGGFTR
jgi:hypothetical protein